MPQKRFQKQIDYIIIGQGIAGTMLSYQLHSRQRSFMLIDDPMQHSSTGAAAGIINYITGRRFVKTWLADTIIPFAFETYRELDRLLGTESFIPAEIYKPLFSVEEREELAQMIEKKGLSDGVSSVKTVGNGFLKPHEAAILIRNTGFVKLKPLMEAWRTYLAAQDSLLEEAFDYNKLEISANGVSYEGIEASKIIFCEGFQAYHNPWFGSLPVTRSHGDTLLIRIDEAFNITHIISKGIYIVPLGAGLYKVGATYLWDTYDPSPTAAGREELIGKLEKLLDVPFEVIAQESGIRPAVKDRRPLLGRHSEHPQLIFFNGLGTKGVSLAPFFAKHLVDHLETGAPLMREVDILRFA